MRDRSVVRTTDAETRTVAPEGLQQAVDAAVQAVQGGARTASEQCRLWHIYDARIALHCRLLGVARFKRNPLCLQTACTCSCVEQMLQQTLLPHVQNSDMSCWIVG